MPAEKLTNSTKLPLNRTKILVTVGPSVNSYNSITDLIKAGTNGFRLNFSHGNSEERSQQVKWIRQASKVVDRPVAILQDLQGPKIRLGDFDDIVKITSHSTISFKYQADYRLEGHLPTQYDLSKKVKRGERILLFDGRIKCRVSSIRKNVIYAEALNDGIVVRRKGINLPDTDFGGDIITAKDKADLVFGSNLNMDYVALSFVQNANDINNLRQILNSLNSRAKIIAKIETKSAVESLEEIVQAADGIMIARGDLAVETTAESVPVVQRRIIGLGLRYAKPTIVATQMLGSMIDNPEPTRAEVSDVATAAILGADTVMLSDETASGQYPLEAVKFMYKVINYTERHTPLSVNYKQSEDYSRQSAISKAVISLAENIKAKAIVAETKSGATALQIASLRSNIPLIAVTSDQLTAGQLSLVHGVSSYVRPVDALAAVKLSEWLRNQKIFEKGDIVVTVSGRYPGVVGATDTIKVRLLE